MRTSHSHPTSWWIYSHPLITWLRGFHHYQLEFFIVIKLYNLLLHVSKVTLTDFSSVLYLNGFLGTSTKRCCIHLNIFCRLWYQKECTFIQLRSLMFQGPLSRCLIKSDTSKLDHNISTLSNHMYDLFITIYLQLCLITCMIFVSQYIYSTV